MRKFLFCLEYGIIKDSEEIEFSTETLSGMTEEQVKEFVNEEWRDWFFDKVSGYFKEIKESKPND